MVYWMLMVLDVNGNSCVSFALKWLSHVTVFIFTHKLFHFLHLTCWGKGMREQVGSNLVAGQIQPNTIAQSPEQPGLNSLSFLWARMNLGHLLFSSWLNNSVLLFLFYFLSNLVFVFHIFLPYLHLCFFPWMCFFFTQTVLKTFLSCSAHLFKKLSMCILFL